MCSTDIPARSNTLTCATVLRLKIENKVTCDVKMDTKQLYADPEKNIILKAAIIGLHPYDDADEIYLIRCVLYADNEYAREDLEHYIRHRMEMFPKDDVSKIDQQSGLNDQCTDAFHALHAVCNLNQIKSLIDPMYCVLEKCFRGSVDSPDYTSKIVTPLKSLDDHEPVPTTPKRSLLARSASFLSRKQSEQPKPIAFQTAISPAKPPQIERKVSFSALRDGTKRTRSADTLPGLKALREGLNKSGHTPVVETRRSRSASFLPGILSFMNPA